MQILLIEDDDEQARERREALEQASSWTVHRAGTAEDALALADEVDPDLAIVPRQLPDADGLDVLEALRARHPRLPVLFVTDDPSEAPALDAVRQGAVDVLSDGPDLPERLAERADAVLAGWPGEGPLVQLAPSTEADPSRRDADAPIPRREDIDEDALQRQTDRLVEGPVEGALVLDRAGRKIAATLPDALTDDAMGRTLLRIHDGIGDLRKHDPVDPRRYGLVVETSGYLLALSAAPGPLVVCLFLRSSTGSMIGLRRAQDAARRIWEAT